MVIEFDTGNFQCHSVKLLYYIKEHTGPIAKEMLPNEYGLYRTTIDYDYNLVYKFLINDKYYINDPRANCYAYINNSYWSKIVNSQLKGNKSIPTVDNIFICKNISDTVEPCEITKVINSLDQHVFCWCKLSDIKENLLISMLWFDSNNEFFSSVELPIKYDGRSIRSCYSGINLENIIDSIIIPKGKWTVFLLINGVFSQSISFNINKFNTYNSRGYINNNFTKINSI